MRGLVSGFIIRRRKRDISVYRVRIQQEDSSLYNPEKDRKRAHTDNQIGQHSDLGVSASRTVRKEMYIV